MRKARTPLFLAALVMILGSVALAASGIEVLSVIPVGEGYLVDSITHDAPAGSHMEAVMYVGGFPVVVDCAPIAPGCGHSVVHFPHNWTYNVLVARGPSGAVLYSRLIKVEGIVEIDNA